MLYFLLSFSLPLLLGQAADILDFRSPANERYAQITKGGTILPGGRILQPLGAQFDTGPGAFGLTISPKGNIATADTGPERYGVTLIEPVKNAWSVRHLWARTPYNTMPETADPNWKAVSFGVAFDTDRYVWVSEGASGKVRLIDTKSGNHLKVVDLNRSDLSNTFTGDLVIDAHRRLLYVIDRTNRRIAVIDSKKGQVLGSVAIGRPLFGICLSPDGQTAYVSDAGGGAAGIIDVRDPRQPSLQKWIGAEDLAGGDKAAIGSGILAVGILAAGNRVYVSNPGEDSITVISATQQKVVAEIPLRIHSLEMFRGVRPGGMAFDPLTKWLLVAETGINAVGVIDTEKNELVGHIPAGWEPNRVAIAGDRVYVTNAYGRGTGPNLRRPLLDYGETPSLHRGSVSIFVMPSAGELTKLTRTVYAANGLIAEAVGARQPERIKHVVLIVKGSGSFDEVLGDVKEANSPLNRRVQAVPQLARFGMHGLADGRRRQLSVKDVAITPNQHAIAQRWAFGDNFYTDSEGSQAASPESNPAAGMVAIWPHLDSHGVAYRRFDQGDSTLTDLVRADRFIAEMQKMEMPPPFIYIYLPDDAWGEAWGNNRDTPPEREGYPYKVSYVAGNDQAVGRILQYLSHTDWWRETVVFVTQATAGGGLDHIDSHRTVLLAAGPWIRPNYVSHINADFAGLRKTIFGIMHVPPIRLRDATARALLDIFTTEPDYSPFEALPADKRILDMGRDMRQ